MKEKFFLDDFGLMNGITCGKDSEYSNLIYQIIKETKDIIENEIDTLKAKHKNS